MARTVIAAAEVKAAATSRRLAVPADAIVTPLARDLAAELGVEISRAPGPAAAAGPDGSATAAGDLPARIQAILAPLLGSGGGGETASSTPTVSRPPVKLSRIADARLQRFPYPGPPPEMQVDALDVVDAEDGAPFAAGYMSITRGRFPWTMSYDELQIVLEGELRLGGDAGNLVGRPGDILFVPRGSAVVFETPTWAKFAYVTFPANWRDQLR